MSQNYQIAVFSDRFLERKEFRPGDLVIVVNMNNRQLKRHDTLPILPETQTDLGSPDSRHDGLSLPPDPTAIADPRIFMLSEAIKQTLDSSFTGLQSTLTAISTQMERIASRPSPFHAHGAGGRISLRTPTSARTRVSPRRHRATTSADGSPSPSSQSGGSLPDRRGNIPQEDQDSDDAVSLLPAEEIPLPAMAQKESKFRVYQDTINKTSEALASPLPEDMALCFNATYHKTSLAETSEVKDLFSTTLHLANIDMVVRTTNNGLFSLKNPAMPIIKSMDAKLQEAQGSLVKSSYVTMKMAEDLAQAQARGDLFPQLYDVLSDHCLHAFTMNSVAVQQLDQVRRLGFKPVLPTHLKGLAKVSPSPHSELFGDDLPAHQKELKDKSDLAESLGRPQEKHSSYWNKRYHNHCTPYSRPQAATQSSSKPNWSQRGHQQDPRPPQWGKQKVCIPTVALTFDPLKMVATCYQRWTLLTRDPGVLHIVSQGVCLDFISVPPQGRTTVYQPCLSATQMATVAKEIESMLRLKVIAPSPLANWLQISPIFTTINKDGTSHLILNLKKLNLLITHIPFKMESIRDVIHLIKPGVWMASVDLHHAYYSVPVYSPHSHFFPFYGKAPTTATSGFPMAMPKLPLFSLNS